MSLLWVRQAWEMDRSSLVEFLTVGPLLPAGEARVYMVGGHSWGLWSRILELEWNLCEALEDLVPAHDGPHSCEVFKAANSAEHGNVGLGPDLDRHKLQDGASRHHGFGIRCMDHI